VVVEPAAYRTAARVLEDVAAERRRFVATAQDGWSGPHRDAFDEEDAGLRRRADEIADHLRATAAALDAEQRCTPR
jgi:hypothetical protein